MCFFLVDASTISLDQVTSRGGEAMAISSGDRTETVTRPRACNGQ